MTEYLKKLTGYMDALKARSHNLRLEGKEFEALELDKVVYELAQIFNLKQYL